MSDEKISYIVLCYNEIQFKRWMETKGKKLQSCKRIVGIEDMKQESERGFSSLQRELIVLMMWSDGKSKEYIQEGARLISRYCQDRRIVGGIKPELVEI